MRIGRFAGLRPQDTQSDHTQASGIYGFVGLRP